MNSILNKVQKIIEENMALHLSHVKDSDLEKNGAVFYMNGKDGTEFDWYVNDKLPPFMVFYHDKDNLGAAKLLLFRDGKVELFLYGEQGKKLIKTVDTNIEASQKDLLILAVTLRNEADDKRIWDADLEDINTDIQIDKDRIDEFKAMQQNYAAMKTRKNLLNLSAYVSKKIIEEGWKVGYMERGEPFNEMDSGWFFAAGNEDEDYFSDGKNIALVVIGAVWQQFDPDIFRYIDMPVGTKLIRISPKDFEMDKRDKEIYLMKRQ